MALQGLEMAFLFVAVCLHLYCDMVVVVGLQGYGLSIIAGKRALNPSINNAEHSAFPPFYFFCTV